MVIIDSQVHPYERDHPGRPWVGRLPGPPEVSGPVLTAAMDDAGVDAAILVSAWTLYRFDPSYAVSVRNERPDRFALIRPFDPADPAVAEGIEAWNRVPGRVAARVMWPPETGAADPGLNLVASTAARLSLPLNLAFAGADLTVTAALAERHPDCSIVVDHLGQKQPLEPPTPDAPFEHLEQAARLAHYGNVSLKISGACTLSKQGYPFADIWDPVMRLIDAFGVDRCMWGSDWTRALDFVTYKQAVDVFLNSPRLSRSDRAALMGGSLQRIYNWAPTGRSAAATS